MRSLLITLLLISPVLAQALALDTVRGLGLKSFDCVAEGKTYAVKVGHDGESMLVLTPGSVTRLLTVFAKNQTDAMQMFLASNEAQTIKDPQLGEILFMRRPPGKSEMEPVKLDVLDSVQCTEAP